MNSSSLFNGDLNPREGESFLKPYKILYYGYLNIFLKLPKASATSATCTGYIFTNINFITKWTSTLIINIWDSNNQCPIKQKDKFPRIAYNTSKKVI